MRTILIADDNDQNNYMLRVLLEAHGYRVVMATNGAEALERARQFPPILIVTDILMPVMDGFALCREWKHDESLKSIPFIFYTATYTDAKDRVFAQNLGVERFLIKPMEPDLLMVEIEAVLAECAEAEPHKPAEQAEGETVYLKEYNQALIRKLEDKMLQLEKTNASLRVSEARYRSLFEDSPISLWEEDLSEVRIYLAEMAISDIKKHFERHPEAIAECLSRVQILDVNRKTLQMFGTRDKEHLSSAYTSIFGLEPFARKIIALANGHPTFEDEVVLQTPRGETLYAVASLSVAPGYEESWSKVFLSIIDITERKLAEEELGQYREHLEELVEVRTGELTRANDHLKTLSRVKDEFISNVSHELRTPISNIKLYHELLIHHPERRDRYLDTLRRETERLSRIIEDLLRLSRLEQEQEHLHLTQVDINTLAHHYVSDRAALASSRELELVFLMEPGLPKIEADPGLLGQVLSVLLTNALNYTPPGGHITVSTLSRQAKDQQWVGFRVSDSGPGIPRDEQARLFERFFRGATAQKSGMPGTGLGLAIASEIVEKHEGLLEVESEGVQGQGTTFSVWLPKEGRANGAH